ncbi:hypothetical protein NHG40_16005 [Bacillus thuringiensis]|uniref:hypothetical protein n=1 Tax=Bacillus thuringiensis TaxID=1428 RepID=UPI0021575F2F|nr:hypothetical protein [Bacillus thuringiensis]MCR6835420.1 hypothetical protein [Bacillus thuringiensis]
MAGKLHENDMNVLFTRKKVYDPSLYDCVLNSECQIVHKSELYDNQMRERARRIRNLYYRGIEGTWQQQRKRNNKEPINIDIKIATPKQALATRKLIMDMICRREIEQR